LFKQTYPRDVTAYINLGGTYAQLGDFEKALANSQDAIRVDPDESRGYHNAAVSYMGLNRPEEAKAVVRAALGRNPNFHNMHDDLANIAYAQGDIAGMEKEEASLHDEPDLEMNVDFRHGEIAADHGQIQKAKEFYEKGTPDRPAVANERRGSLFPCVASLRGRHLRKFKTGNRHLQCRACPCSQLQQ